MKVFITGAPGCGKTYLINNIANFLKDNGFSISGFITEEVREDSKRVGFKIKDLSTQMEKIFASKVAITPYRFGNYFINLINFEEIALNAFSGGDVKIIDEIGKMEFYSEKFRKILFENMYTNINLVATLHRDFIKDFKDFGQIFFLTQENREEIGLKIINLIRGALI